MGILEAWKDAEKVGYPVVGEEVKDASNVIDYNIRPEQTKDMSAEINANNQTTTGMATVIPGVNAPKLIATTSIIGMPEADPDFAGGVTAYFTSGNTPVPSNSQVEKDITDANSITDQRGYYQFKYVVGKGLEIPASGAWTLNCRYAGASGSLSDNDCKSTVVTMLGNKTIRTCEGSRGGDYTTETFVVNAKKGEFLHFYMTLFNRGGDVNNITSTVRCIISK